eukprot:TRINITY_DN9942_c0_g2_i1.p1 TRINITY_DN9942_c0_g2~~TRINITY_DN9942_c0_g2_i1.p1  ORF type:complete len:418 (+),score=82.55 TRINITY_DN9942_c0_g2_i1:260-1513(+)
MGQTKTVDIFQYDHAPLFLIKGSIPLALSYWLLWQVPTFITQNHLVYYYLGVLLLLNFVDTGVNVPYGSLTPELAPEYDERTLLTTIRFFCGMMGGIFGGFIHAILIDLYKRPEHSAHENEIAARRGFTLSASVLCPIIGILPLITAIFVRETRTNPIKRESVRNAIKSYFLGFRATFSNKAYILLLLIFLFSSTLINFIQSNLALWVKYVVKMDVDFPYFLLTVQGSAAVSMLLIERMSKRFGKKKTYWIGMFILFCNMIGIFFATETVPKTVVYLFCVLGGVGVATGLIIPWSMLPDVIDLDRLTTSKRREGELYSIFSLLQKVALALALALSGYALEGAGYLEPEERLQDDPLYQPEAVIWTLKTMVAGIPAAMVLMGCFVVYFYPIDQKRHAEILDLLRAKEDEDNANLEQEE